MGIIAEATPSPIDAIAQADPSHWLFCYGTLRDDRLFVELTQLHTTTRVPAILFHWHRVEVPGTPHCGVVRASKDACVQGELRHIASNEVWALLDDYEGSNYERVPCVVRVDSTQVEAQVYQYRPREQ